MKVFLIIIMCSVFALSADFAKGQTVTWALLEKVKEATILDKDGDKSLACYNSKEKRQTTLVIEDDGWLMTVVEFEITKEGKLGGSTTYWRQWSEGFASCRVIPYNIRWQDDWVGFDFYPSQPVKLSLLDMIKQCKAPFEELLEIGEPFYDVMKKSGIDLGLVKKGE